MSLGSLAPSPSPSAAHLDQVEGMNWSGPTAWSQVESPCQVADSGVDRIAANPGRPSRAGPRIGLLERPSLRSEEHTSELQSLMRISYAVFCLKKQKYDTSQIKHHIMK